MDQSTYFISSLNNESCPLGVSEWATQTILSKNDVTQSPTNIFEICVVFLSTNDAPRRSQKLIFEFSKKNHVGFFSTNDAPRRSRKTNFRISCGFFFHKWRSTIYPVCGFFFHNLQIGVKCLLTYLNPRSKHFCSTPGVIFGISKKHNEKG